MTWFDESRLDDERALAGIDLLLRSRVDLESGQILLEDLLG